MSGLPLPENIDSSFDDRPRPGDKLHQQHHDVIHREINSLEGRFGDVHNRIDDLETGEVEGVIDEVLNRVGGEVVLIASNLVDEHSEDPNPHPAYDDGPSFTLLYENAKV